MIYRRRFEMDLEELKPELKIVRSATEELRGSKQFKRLLMVRCNATFQVIQPYYCIDGLGCGQSFECLDFQRQCRRISARCFAKAKGYASDQCLLWKFNIAALSGQTAAK